MFKTNEELLKAFRDNFCTPCTSANTCGDCVLQDAWSAVETPANKVLHADVCPVCEGSNKSFAPLFSSDEPCPACNGQRR